MPEANGSAGSEGDEEGQLYGGGASHFQWRAVLTSA
jgi:hypothetical protein